MTKKAISVYMAATCAISIITPGRFVCGIIFSVEICLLMLCGILFRALINLCKLQKVRQILILMFVVYLTMFYKNLLIIIMPELALQLGFSLFLPTISTFSTVFLMEDKTTSLKENLKNDLPGALLFSVYTLFISFVRDLLGFGTITLPAIGSFKEYIIFDTQSVSAASFVATIPGSLVLSALLLSLYLFVENKFHILKRAGIKL